jgi:O-antigen/teichoic acid export membrane protein
MVEVLAVGLLLLPLQLATYTFVALNKPQWNSRFLSVRLLSLIILIPLGWHFAGLYGAIWGVVISQFSAAPWMIYASINVGVFNIKRELLPLPSFAMGYGAGSIASFLWPSS